MSEGKKNYNINTLRGVLNDDDMEVCQTLGLDPSIAYTPQMVQAQLDRDVPPEKHAEVLASLKKYM